MANYYIATTGNDSTGNGSSGNPWKTLNKAFTQNASLAFGDNIFLADGTYIENSSSSGYWNITRTPIAGSGTFVTITPTLGVTGNVTVIGTAGTGSYDCVLGITNNIKFNYIKFGSANDLKITPIRLNGAASNVYFYKCTFTCISKSSQVNFSISCASASALSNIVFDDCDINQTGTDNARGIHITPTAQLVSGIIVANCRITNTGHTAVFSGVTGLIFANNVCNSTGIVGGYACMVGSDAAIGTYNSDGLVLNNYLNSASGHTCIFGGSNTTGRVSGNTIIGGYSNTAGQGLVLKNCTVKAIGNIIYDGYNSGLYMKASVNCTVLYNIIVNRYSDTASSGCIRLGVNSENNSKASGNTIKYNKCIVSAKQAFYWEGIAGDDGTNIVDNNEYYFTPGISTIWGVVYGVSTAGQSLVGLKMAWSTTPKPKNDGNSSMFGNSTNVIGSASTAKSVYSLIYDTFGKIWNGESFEVMADFKNNIGRYQMPMYEQVPGNEVYAGIYLNGLPHGLYTIVTKQMTGYIAAQVDAIINIQSILWSGSKIPTTTVTFQTIYTGI